MAGAAIPSSCGSVLFPGLKEAFDDFYSKTKTKPAPEKDPSSAWRRQQFKAAQRKLKLQRR